VSIILGDDPLRGWECLTNKIMTTEQAIKTLSKALREDKDYRHSWTANIAMAYIDAEAWVREDNNNYGYISKQQRREIANTAAEHFIQQMEK
jgi:hypothetical protein